MPATVITGVNAEQLVESNQKAKKLFIDGDVTALSQSARKQIRLERWVQEFGITTTNTRSEVPVNDQLTILQAAIDLSAAEGFTLRFEGVIAIDGTLTLNSGASLVGSGQDQSIIYQLSPIGNSGIESADNGGNGAANITLRDFCYDGGWDKTLDSGNWNFDHADARLEGVYGINVWCGFLDAQSTAASLYGDSDPRNDLQNLTVKHVAGTAFRRAGRGAGRQMNWTAQDCARYAIEMDQCNDEYLIGGDFANMGAGGILATSGGHVKIKDVKLWFLNRSVTGAAVPVFVQTSSGSFDWDVDLSVQDSNATCLELRGRNHKFKIRADAIGEMYPTYSWGNPSPGNIHHWKLAGARDCELDYVISNFRVTDGRTPVANMGQINGDVRDCRVRVTGDFNAGYDVVKNFNVNDDISNYNNKYYNEVTINNAPVINGNKGYFVTGLSTMMLLDSTSSINRAPNKFAGKKHFVDDLRREVFAIGSGVNDGWRILGEDTNLRMECINPSVADITEVSGTIQLGESFVVGVGSGVLAGADNRVFTYRGGDAASTSSYFVAYPVNGFKIYDVTGSKQYTYDADTTSWV